MYIICITFREMMPSKGLTLPQVCVSFRLFIAATVVALLLPFVSEAVQPVVHIHSLNWFIEEFNTYWIHITLKSSIIQIEPPEYPISISGSQGMRNKYKVPSRHLQRSLPVRLIILLMPQYNEPEGYNFTRMIYSDGYGYSDCIGKVQASSYTSGCFNFPEMFALWTSTWTVGSGLSGLSLAYNDYNRFNIKHILFKTRMVEMDEIQNEVHYDVDEVYGAHHSLLLIKLQNCNGEKQSMDAGRCRQEVDEINEELVAGNPGPQIERRWGVFNESSKMCDSYGTRQTTIEGVLGVIRNLTRKSIKSSNITANPFKPEPVSLELIIKYMIIGEIQFELQDERCDYFEKFFVNITLNDWMHAEFQWIESSRKGRYTSARSALILLKTEDWYVATCDGIYESLSYQFFLDPYDSASWVMCLATIILITAFILAVVMWKDVVAGGGGSLSSIVYNLLAIGFGVLLGVPPYMRRELKRKKIIFICFMLTFGSWTLLSLIFSAAYKGLFVSQLTSPVPIKSPWNSITELDGFTFYSRRFTFGVPRQYQGKAYTMEYLNEWEFTRLVNGTIGPICINTTGNISKAAIALCPLIEQLHGLGIKDENIPEWYTWTLLERNSSEVTIPNTIVLASLEPRYFVDVAKITDSSLTRNETLSFERAFSTCSKTGILESDEQLPYFSEYLRMRAQAVDQSRAARTPVKIGGPIGKEWISYEFSHEAGDRVSHYAYRRLQNIVSSGVYQIWEKWYNKKYSKAWRAEMDRLQQDDKSLSRRDRNVGPKPLSMNSNFQAAFYIFGYGCLIGFCSLVLEVVIPGGVSLFRRITVNTIWTSRGFKYNWN